MPAIRSARPVDGPPAAVSLRRREYPSPDGRWRVCYHTPREWHMGADGWRVRLHHHGFPSWGHRRELSRLAGTHGFRCEQDLRPWSHDSHALVFLTWDEDPVHVYDVAAKTARRVPCGSAWVHSVQWSPRIDRLLVTFPTAAVLLDQGGTRRGTASWSIASGERPHTDWTQDGRWFFVLARGSKTAKVMVSFHAGQDGAVAGAYELDPSDLVPYDADQFAHLPRDRFCLVVAPSVGAVGELLDTWHSVQFHQPSATLYLAVYRPVLSVSRDVAGHLCHVEERWVAVELGT